MLRILKPNYQECSINGNVVDSQIILNNKLFHGDILNDDSSLFSSNKEKMLLGGFIKFKNVFKFGVNKKGDELFEFQPINWRYPKFLVASKIKKNLLKKKEKVVDYFIVIQFKEWKNKLPIGIIHHIIGPINNINNQYEIVLYYYGKFNFSTTKSNIELKDNYELKQESNIFTIDPIGCIDMDDAISYDSFNKRIGIHIIDIESYNLNKKQDLFSSIYAPHKTIHMLNELISLEENKCRNVITCWINENEEFTFEENVIKVTKNLTYDQAELEIKKGNKDLKILFEKSKKIGKILNIEVIDTHKMIEVFMIFYNKNILSKLNVPIYRNQELNKKAYYSFENKGHYSLNLKEYTHASSPIRRYIDLLIQKLFKSKEITVDLNKINEFNNDINYLYKIWDNQKMSQIIKVGNFYELIFIEFYEGQVIFECQELNSRIYNKINYSIVCEDIIEINSVKFKINEKYNCQLFLKQDQKHTLFSKVLIQFENKNNEFLLK